MTHIDWNSLLDYQDGFLFWKETAPARVRGKMAGFVQSKGYQQIRHAGKAYFVHVIIWEMHNGPSNLIVDHRDRNKQNNLISNLRLATKSQNEANTPPRSTNTTGYKGVVKSACGKKFRAILSVGDKQQHIGMFDTAESAASAYNKVAYEIYGEFAWLNPVN